jgi:hypothetical protein
LIRRGEEGRRRLRSHMWARSLVNNRNEVRPSSLSRRIVHSPLPKVIRMVGRRTSSNLQAVRLGGSCGDLARLTPKGAIEPIRARPVHGHQSQDRQSVWPLIGPRASTHLVQCLRRPLRSGEAPEKSS